MIDLAQFSGGATRLGANYASDSECRLGQPATVEIRKPSSGEILRLYPGMSCPVNCGEFRGKITLLPGSLRPETRSNPKERLLRVATNNLGDVFLWPVPVIGNTATQLKGLLRDAEAGWIRIHWDKEHRRYEHQAWDLDKSPPRLAATLEQLIAIASPELLQQYQQEQRPNECDSFNGMGVPRVDETPRRQPD